MVDYFSLPPSLSPFLTIYFLSAKDEVQDLVPADRVPARQMLSPNFCFELDTVFLTSEI